MIKTIYVFGNELLGFDNLPIKLVPHLKKEFPDINFQIIDPNENLKPIKKELIIIDTIDGINNVQVITDLDKIKTEKIYSVHDFDLGFNLKLLKKIGKLEKVLIFGVPMKGKKKIILNQLIFKIKSPSRMWGEL